MSFPLTTDARAAALALPRTDQPVDVVIDTDVTNEIDDQFAVVWALGRPDRVRLHALYACPYAFGTDVLALPGVLPTGERQALAAAVAADPAGMAQLIPAVDAATGAQRAAAECRHLTALTGRPEVPVLAGAARFLAADGGPVDSPAVRHLIALAHAERPGPLYVVGIGCATNLASALLLDPTIAARVCYVWTSAYPTFWPYANASFNLALDAAASRVLFSSGVPLVYLPGYYVGEELRVSWAELDAHLSHGPVGRYLRGIAAASPLLGTTPGRSKVIWDLITVAYLVNPGWLTTVERPTPTLGTAFDWVDAGPAAPLLREAVDVDRDAVITDVLATVARLDTAAGDAPGADRGRPATGQQ